MSHSLLGIAKRSLPKFGQVYHLDAKVNHEAHFWRSADGTDSAFYPTCDVRALSFLTLSAGWTTLDGRYRLASAIRQGQQSDQSGRERRCELFLTLDSEMFDRLPCVDGALQPIWRRANAIPGVAIGVPEPDDARDRVSCHAGRHETTCGQEMLVGQPEAGHLGLDPQDGISTLT
ncbi:hypothetical protein [Cupriavidus oxalaticus]|uniref:hypothetical protein n=1 Tax=Cupriavidus oxalaticus TaxID=96344 RepID=UPI003F73D87D